MPEWLRSASVDVLLPCNRVSEDAPGEEASMPDAASHLVPARAAPTKLAPAVAAPRVQIAEARITTLAQLPRETSLSVLVMAPQKTSKHWAHRLHVRVGMREWQVLRRYTAFRRLHESLARALKLPKFAAPKEVFHTSSALRKRLSLLQDFLDMCLSRARNSSTSYPALEAFLGMHTSVALDHVSAPGPARIDEPQVGSEPLPVALGRDSTLDSDVVSEIVPTHSQALRAPYSPSEMTAICWRAEILAASLAYSDELSAAWIRYETAHAQQTRQTIDAVCINQPESREPIGPTSYQR